MKRTGLGALQIERSEIPSLVASAALFFFILASYYVLRPVRDEMAVRAGAASLKWLFTATFVTMLVATPAFGWVSARVQRSKLVPGLLLFFLCHMVLFRVALQDPGMAHWVPAVMFVWVSVFNLFVVSIFWSLMADVFTLDQAERLFGAISVGGTAGAITGPMLTATLAGRIGVPNLLLVSAALLLAGAVLAGRLARDAFPGRPAAGGSPARPLGGGAWEGLGLVARSPYLLAFCAYLALHSFVGTVLYFEQTRVVGAEIPTPEARTSFFAGVDLAVNTLTVVTQLLGLAPLVRRFGLATALAALPALTLAGLAVLAIHPTLAVLVVLGVVRRAGEYAIARPAREMLFTVLPRTIKYKAKNFLDTAVFRGSDALSSWLVDTLRVAGIVGAGAAAATLPAAIGGLWLGWRLGRSRAVTTIEEHANATSGQSGAPEVAAAGHRRGARRNDDR
ncbi:MAG: MFS transporter [Betaproteobacteria bacterium]|nr:MFS transporter [Betaproteobacteria bacterium]